ncbi:uncharacterized protein [Ptychodera flava]|uniref:uncharacterized protein n=1 Tax=Ptychodera flava TaxID=63121 RepID=UPI003969C3F9
MDQSQNRVEYWESRANHCDGIQKVMNYACADEMTKLEIPELLAVLPPLEGKSILELGAGIGRFTTALAQKAGHVTAVDLIEKFTEENRQNNSHFGNVDFVTSDVAKLEVPRTYDLVFSNFLLQYLDEKECRDVVMKTISWLNKDGYVFFRESAKDERDLPGPPKSNASLYRHPTFYTDIFNNVRKPVEGNTDVAELLKILQTGTVQCVKKVMSRDIDTHHFWVLQKVSMVNANNEEGPVKNGIMVNGNGLTNGDAGEVTEE